MNNIREMKMEEQLRGLKDDYLSLSEKLASQDNLAESINLTYRKIHTLKSNLFLIDRNRSLKMTYMMELQFDRMRKGEAQLTQKLLELFSECTDWIGSDIFRKDGSEELYEKLLYDLKSAKENEFQPKNRIQLTSDEKELLRDGRNSGMNIFMVQYKVPDHLNNEKTYNLPIFKKIDEIGLIAVQIPTVPAETQTLKIVFVTTKKLKELTDPLFKSAQPFDEDLYLSYGSHKILIVEDNPVAQLLQKSIMGDFGVTDTVKNGEMGLELFKLALEERAPYDMVILDLVMPGIGGGEVLKGIRKLESDNNIKGLDRCKVIVTTTNRESSTLMDLFRAEADAYIIKPLTKEKIVREMKELKLI